MAAQHGYCNASWAHLDFSVFSLVGCSSTWDSIQLLLNAEYFHAIFFMMADWDSSFSKKIQFKNVYFMLFNFVDQAYLKPRKCN
jgi:hypothetical protein